MVRVLICCLVLLGACSSARATWRPVVEIVNGTPTIMIDVDSLRAGFFHAIDSVIVIDSVKIEPMMGELYLAGYGRKFNGDGAAMWIQLEAVPGSGSGGVPMRFRFGQESNTCTGHDCSYCVFTPNEGCSCRKPLGDRPKCDHSVTTSLIEIPGFGFLEY